MIKIDLLQTAGIDPAIHGMRNPMNSWGKSDSAFCVDCLDECYDECAKCSGYRIGPNDKKLMMSLAKAGTEHSKYRRMIVVWTDIIAPLYWWKEFDTYKVGTVANSCSTIHKIHAKEFAFDDFSTEHLKEESVTHFECTIDLLNHWRNQYLETKDKDDWWQMIQILPSSYNQRRTVMLNYEVLANIYRQRKNHKLDEWLDFCKWIEELPHSWIITGKEEMKDV